MTRTTLQIRRPEGHVETVDVTAKISYMTPQLFARVKKATEGAGRGTVLSYRNESIDDRTDAEKAMDEIMALYDRAEDLRTGSGEYDYANSFKAKSQADAAMKAWRETYPEAAAERDEEIRAERDREAARRKEDYENSFVARNLD